jgi:hypothetical protein
METWLLTKRKTSLEGVREQGAEGDIGLKMIVFLFFMDVKLCMSS